MNISFDHKLSLTFVRSILAALLCAASIGSASAAPSLMTPAISSKAVQSRFDIKSEVKPVVLNRAAMATLRKQDELEFVLPNAARHTIVFDRIEDHGDGIRSSVGYLKGRGTDFRVIITTGPAGSYGSIRTPETVYRIIPGDNGHDFLVDMTEEQKLIPASDYGEDGRKIPVSAAINSRPGGQPATPTISPDTTQLAVDLKARGQAAALARTSDQPIVPAISLAIPTPQVTVDLMVVYTNGLQTKLGAGLLTRINNLVTAANTAYIDSEVAITLRLVNTTMVNYTDAGSNGPVLDAITPVFGGGTGVFAAIETTRATVGADLVTLMRDGSANGGSGIAWITTSDPADPLFMYSVVTGCTAGCDSLFIHELGHNMGNGHDTATTAFQQGGQAVPFQEGAKPYSFGKYYCDAGTLTCNPNLPSGSGGCSSQPQCSATAITANNVGTIMSYFNPVTLKFSNPNLMCSRPGGVAQPCGVANQLDNARSMNEMRFAVANAKPAAGPPPTTFAVTPSTTSANGTISPNTVQNIPQGAATNFTVTPNVGYSASVGGTCGGSLVGTTFSTSTINAACTVIASFTLKTYAVTPSTTSANGTISPNTAQTINHGSTTIFTVTPNTGYTASVAGTCGGSLVGTTYTTSAITAACTVVATFTIKTYAVTPSITSANGTISPNTAQVINHGTTTAFTVTPNPGYTASVSGTCGGALVGTTYTTNAVTAACTVVASFTLNTYLVTSSTSSGNGTISPTGSQLITHGSTTAYPLTPNAGFSANVSGTCGGTLAGNTFTTATITSPCTVVASFVAATFSVTPSTTSGNGTISPNTAQTVNQGATSVFTVTPLAGFSASVGGTCPGSLVGTTYTTGAINSNCTVVASFTALPSSTTVLNSSRNPSSLAQAVTFTATVSGGGATPTGTVAFKDGGVTIAGCAAVPLAAGVAQCVTSSLLIGAHSITAQYSGSGTYSLSNSNTVTQTVNPINLQPILFFFLD